MFHRQHPSPSSSGVFFKGFGASFKFEIVTGKFEDEDESENGKLGGAETVLRTAKTTDGTR